MKSALDILIDQVLDDSGLDLSQDEKNRFRRSLEDAIFNAANRLVEVYRRG